MPITKINNKSLDAGSVDLASNVVTGLLPDASVSYQPSGTGAVATTVQNKLRKLSISPEDFGAIGNNVVDDTVAMLAAMTEAVTSGITLSLKDGATYFLNTWTPFSNSGFLHIKGNGASTLRGPASTVVFLSPAANFNIQGVTFSTWSTVASRDVAQTGSFTDVIFSNNTCSSCTAPVISIEKPITQYRIENNNIISCTGGYGIRIGESAYSNQDTWQEGWVTNNRINSLSASGAVSAVAILVYGRRVTIANNKIDGVTQSGTGEAWGIYTKARYSHVHGNFVNNVVAAGSSDNVGINIKGGTRNVTSTPQGFAVIVWGNHVSNIGVAGTKGVGIRAQTDNVLVFGNMCEDTGAAGLNSDESTAYSNVQFQNNSVQWATKVAGQVGIRLEGRGTGVVADNNTVTRGWTGILLSANSVLMQDAQVTRNKFFTCDYNIVFDASAACTLDGAVIDYNVVDSGVYGILYNGSAGTVSNLRVRFNDFTRAATSAAGSALTGATLVAYDNQGWLKSMGTWNPGSVAVGSSLLTTIVVGGAVPGDIVQASFSLDLGGLALCAQVKSANTVEVMLINNTAAPVDLASGTLKVIVLKK